MNTSTGDNTNEAAFLAPKTHQKEGAKRYRRIGDFRDVIDQLDWNRNDLRGATRQELRRMDVEARLSPYIDAVNECVPFVDPRFVIDLEYAREAIQRAKDAIDEWKRARA